MKSQIQNIFSKFYMIKIGPFKPQLKIIESDSNETQINYGFTYLNKNGKIILLFLLVLITFYLLFGLLKFTGHMFENINQFFLANNLFGIGGNLLMLVFIVALCVVPYTFIKRNFTILIRNSSIEFINSSLSDIAKKSPIANRFEIKTSDIAHCYIKFNETRKFKIPFFNLIIVKKDGSEVSPLDDFFVVEDAFAIESELKKCYKNLI